MIHTDRKSQQTRLSSYAIQKQRYHFFSYFLVSFRSSLLLVISYVEKLDGKGEYQCLNTFPGMFMDENVERCPGCSTVLSEPYIQCAECGPHLVNICLHCFSRGLQTNSHKNDHKYYVIVSIFIIKENIDTGEYNGPVISPQTHFNSK